MRTDIKFFPAVSVPPIGESRKTVFGVGVDRSLWVQAALANLTDVQLDNLRRQYGADNFCAGPGGRLYVDTRVLVLDCPLPSEQELMVHKARILADLFRPVISPHDEPTADN
jgi:hypothetical protein